MTDITLRADCARCAALCCVALAFDRSEQFAFDKRAGEMCRHLGEDCQCRIHEQFVPQGMTGCARYDCLGAGQRVVQEVFGGRSWQNDPALLRPMIEAFRAMRKVHELATLLHIAERLPLLNAERTELGRMLDELAPSQT